MMPYAPVVWAKDALSSRKSVSIGRMGSLNSAQNLKIIPDFGSWGCFLVFGGWFAGQLFKDPVKGSLGVEAAFVGYFNDLNMGTRRVIHFSLYLFDPEFIDIIAQARKSYFCRPLPRCSHSDAHCWFRTNGPLNLRLAYRDPSVFRNQ